MYLTRLKRVQRVLPRHLPKIAAEADGDSVLKAWLLDDTLPSADGAWSPAQEFVRNSAGRRWLHETTGNLVTVYLLDAAIEAEASAPEDDDGPGPVIDVLAQRLPYALANHRLAELLGLAPEELPALVGYVSLDLDAYCHLSLRDAATVAEVKSLLSQSLQQVRRAAEEILGAERTAALLQAGATEPISPSEAVRIAEVLRLRAGLDAAGGGLWRWAQRGATVAELLEKVAGWL